MLTKQAVAPLGVIMFVYLLLVDRRRLLAYAASLGLTLAVPLAVLEVQSGQWATLFLLQLPRQHEISDLRLDQFWRYWMLPRFTLALPMGMLFLFARVQAKDYRAALFYGLITAGMLGVAWASDANPGASLNVLLPAYAILSILFGLGLHEALFQLNRVREHNSAPLAFALSVGILQLILLIYNPRLMVPYRSDTWANERLANTLAALPGRLFAPDFDSYVQQRSEGVEQPFTGAFAELLGGYGGRGAPQGNALRAQLSDRLQRREYDYVVLDPDSQWFFFSGTLRDAGYVDAGPLFAAGDEFWLWHTAITPKSELYVPKERLHP
jgi:hypothetical protein